MRQQQASSEVVFFQLLMFVIVVLIASVVSAWVTIHLLYTVEIKWWLSPPIGKQAIKKYGGAQYANQFSMVYYISMTYEPLLQGCLYLVTPASARLTDSQRMFVRNFLMKRRLMLKDDTNEQEWPNCLTPRMLCESASFSPDDGDQYFLEWWKNSHKNVGRTLSAQTYAKWERFDSPAVAYDKDHNKIDTPIYGYRRVFDGDAEAGLWPSPDDTEGWKGQWLDWLNVDNDGNDFNSEYSKGVWAIWQDKYLQMVPQWIPGDGTHDQWANWWHRYDNFCGRMGLTPMSPLAVYFFGGKISANGNSYPLPQQAFNDLLTGGWIGFLKSSGDASAVELESLVKSNVDSAPKPGHKPCQKPSFGQNLMNITVGALGALAAAMVIPGAGFGMVAGSMAVAGTASGLRGKDGSCT